jgi:hypothetical protein
MDSNFNIVACAADPWSMQISHTTPQKNEHFCGMPHFAPRRTILHYAALVPRDAAFVLHLLWQIPH